MRLLQSCLPLIAALAVTAPLDVPFEFHHDHVPGTQLELRIWAADEESATAAEQRVLAEIDRLSGICSTYDVHSDVSRWLLQGRSILPVDAACRRFEDAAAGV